jgi:hypothetical protein
LKLTLARFGSTTQEEKVTAAFLGGWKASQLASQPIGCLGCREAFGRDCQMGERLPGNLAGMTYVSMSNWSN